jgi:hypothetical protein
MTMTILPTEPRPLREVDAAARRSLHGDQGAAGDAGRVRRVAQALRVHSPSAARATQAGAQATTIALQRLPDSTLRWMAATSLGLAAGLQVAGAPRLARAAGIVPALFMGAAIALRPATPVVPTP